MLKAFVAIQAEVIVNEFIECLLLKYQITHFRRELIWFVIVLANVLLDVDQNIHGQITR